MANYRHLSGQTGESSWALGLLLGRAAYVQKGNSSSPLRYCVLSCRSYGKIIVISSSSPWALVHSETTLGSASLQRA